MDAIILAAGNSSRFGENKLLYKVDGKLMYEHVFDHILQLHYKQLIEHIIFVTQYETLADRIKLEHPQVVIVRNPEANLGISHSVSLGVEKLLEVNPQSRNCVFAVSDQPYLQRETLEGFIGSYQLSKKGMGICTYENRMGNPVIFDQKYYEELWKMIGDKGGKQVVMRHLEDTFSYQVTERELEDIDVR